MYYYYYYYYYCMCPPGVGESIQDIRSVCQSIPLQHHQGGRSLCILSGSYGAARLQAQALQDQDQSLGARGRPPGGPSQYPRRSMRGTLCGISARRRCPTLYTSQFILTLVPLRGNFHKIVPPLGIS